MLEWNGGTADSIATSQLQGPWFDPELQLLSVHSFTCSPRVSMDCLPVLWFPPTCQKLASRLIGDSKLPLDVNEFVNVCAREWTDIPSRAYSYQAQCSCDSLRIHGDPDQDKAITEEQCGKHRLVISSRAVPTTEKKKERGLLFLEYQAVLKSATGFLLQPSKIKTPVNSFQLHFICIALLTMDCHKAALKKYINHGYTF